MAGNKTEKPTHKKRTDARKKGQVARSKEMPAALVFLAVFIYLSVAGSSFIEQSQTIFRHFWGSFLFIDINEASARMLIADALWKVAILAGPLVLIIMAASVGGRLLQGSIALSAEPLKLSLKGLNPASNVKKVFSSKGVVELAKALALVFVLGFIVWSVLGDNASVFTSMAAMDLHSILRIFGELLFRLTWRIAIVLVVIAVADFGFQKYKFEKDLKQTKQEVKDDHKQTEGDPQVKGRIRSLQREMARKRMIAAVKDADVVITNPTHYAVALKYDVSRMAAPQLVAKGKGFLAARIREVAQEHRVPLVENPPLARSLYRSVEVDQSIPEQLYKAVAQILAYVFKLKQNQSK